jgi:hypothetical protein
VSAEEFQSSPVAITAWKTTVAKACSSENSDLIRVTIISVEDIARRVLAGLVTPAHTLPGSPRGKDINDVLSTLKINFEVSYTLQDLKKTNVEETTASLKTNYEQSVVTQAFVVKFAEEIKLRSNGTSSTEAAIVERIQPAEVVLEEAYKVVQTTDHPTYRPSASPTTGELRSSPLHVSTTSFTSFLPILMLQLRRHFTGSRRPRRE